MGDFHGIDGGFAAKDGTGCLDVATSERAFMRGVSATLSVDEIAPFIRWLRSEFPDQWAEATRGEEQNVTAADRRGNWPSEADTVPPSLRGAMNEVAPSWDWHECGGFLVARLHDEPTGETRVLAKIYERREMRL